MQVCRDVSRLGAGSTFLKNPEKAIYMGTFRLNKAAAIQAHSPPLVTLPNLTEASCGEELPALVQYLATEHYIGRKPARPNSAAKIRCCST
jgi:hypothetical protein